MSKTRMKNTPAINKNTSPDEFLSGCKSTFGALKSTYSCPLLLRCYLSYPILPFPSPKVNRDLPGYQQQPHGQHVCRTRRIFLFSRRQKPASSLNSKSWQLFPLWCGWIAARAPRNLWWPTKQLLPLLPSSLAPN